MGTRSATHAKDEKVVFEAFLSAHTSFAAQVKDVEQPDDEFPDVIVTTTGGAVVDFELAEWLHGPQMAEAKHYDRAVEAILGAVGPQGPNPSRHFRAVMLSPREDVPKFDPADRAGFQAEVRALVQETEARWPAERFWHSPQGRLCRELAEYPTLGKYLHLVHFDPRVVRGAARPWPPSQPWIVTELRGGSYSPETALAALRAILEQKIRHYGRFTRPRRG